MKRRKKGGMVHGARKVFDEYDFWEAMPANVISRQVVLGDR